MSQDAPGSALLTVILTVGAGMLFGAWTDEAWGFAVGLALGYLAAQRWNLAQRR